MAPKRGRTITRASWKATLPLVNYWPDRKATSRPQVHFTHRQSSQNQNPRTLIKISLQNHQRMIKRRARSLLKKFLCVPSTLIWPWAAFLKTFPLKTRFRYQEHTTKLETTFSQPQGQNYFSKDVSFFHWKKLDMTNSKVSFYGRALIFWTTGRAKTTPPKTPREGSVFGAWQQHIYVKCEGNCSEWQLVEHHPLEAFSEQWAAPLNWMGDYSPVSFQTYFLCIISHL